MGVILECLGCFDTAGGLFYQKNTPEDVDSLSSGVFGLFNPAGGCFLFKILPRILEVNTLECPGCLTPLKGHSLLTILQGMLGSCPLDIWGCFPRWRVGSSFNHSRKRFHESPGCFDCVTSRKGYLVFSSLQRMLGVYPLEWLECLTPLEAYFSLITLQRMPEVIAPDGLLNSFNPLDYCQCMKPSRGLWVFNTLEGSVIEPRWRVRSDLKYSRGYLESHGGGLTIYCILWSVRLVV